MATTLNDIQKGGLFKMCGEKKLADVGFEYGLDKDYKSVAAMKVAVSKYYNQVKNDPERYGVSLELVDEVVSKVESRFRSMTKDLDENGLDKNISLKEKMEIINPTDIKGLVVGGRNKAAKLMYEKLDRIGKSKKALDELDLGKLATVLGILVDKGQIIQGQSTENIAILSKNIDKSLSPEDALELVLRSREQNMETK